MRCSAGERSRQALQQDSIPLALFGSDISSSVYVEPGAVDKPGDRWAYAEELMAISLAHNVSREMD